MRRLLRNSLRTLWRLLRKSLRTLWRSLEDNVETTLSQGYGTYKHRNREHVRKDFSQYIL
jgi:hypothetical protein